MQMNFLGSIGHPRAISGLQELVKVVYADSTLSHLMTGKAISRAVCDHMLEDVALHTILVAYTYDVSVPIKESVVLKDTSLAHWAC